MYFFEEIIIKLEIYDSTLAVMRSDAQIMRKLQSGIYLKQLTFRYFI